MRKAGIASSDSSSSNRRRPQAQVQSYRYRYSERERLEAEDGGAQRDAQHLLSLSRRPLPCLRSKSTSRAGPRRQPRCLLPRVPPARKTGLFAAPAAAAANMQSMQISAVVAVAVVAECLAQQLPIPASASRSF